MTPQYTSTLISAMIGIGAVIMLINILRFRQTIKSLPGFILSASKRRLHTLGRLHQILMAFFLLGYLTVAYAILRKIAFVSEFFVGLIFLLGSVFVWLGILIQHQMLALLQTRYEQALQAKAELEEERSRLKASNIKIQSEVEERRRAEDALRDNQQRLKLILDQLPAGVLIIDEATRRIKDANPAALALIGRPIQDVLGCQCHQLMCPVPAEECPATDENQEVENAKMMLVKEDGQQIAIMKSISRITLDGQACLLESFIDISDKERLEAQLLRAQKMEALGTMAGGVAHDLNNILSGIVSYPDLLLQDIAPDSPLRSPIETIKSTGEKAATIVQDMLTLARRGVSIEMVVELKQVISDYYESPEHRRLQRLHPNVTFKKHVSQKLFNIEGSSVHLAKVIMNLCSNAADAIEDRGDVVIKAENRYVDQPLKGYDTVEEGDYAVITVSDNGIGIAEEDQERIFEPFFTKKHLGASGTGLGMAVVWGTVKDHRGYVHVDSTLGKGTSLTLYFPASREKVVQQKETVDISKCRGVGESILIVDDVAEQRLIATDILTMLNYAPHAVVSGEEAIAYLQNHAVDLVLLDMIMAPGMGGLETYQKILKINPNQRALLVSGYSETDEVRQALQLGAGQYVKKPYTMKTIGMAIHRELHG